MGRPYKIASIAPKWREIVPEHPSIFDTEDTETFGEDTVLLDLYATRICRRVIAWQVNELEELPKSIEDEALLATFKDEVEFQELVDELESAINGTDALGQELSDWKAQLVASR